MSNSVGAASTDTWLPLSASGSCGEEENDSRFHNSTSFGWPMNLPGLDNRLDVRLDGQDEDVYDELDDRGVLRGAAGRRHW